MAGDRYFVRNQHVPHFLTMTVVRWVDLFTRSEYKHVITDSLTYCTRHKGLTVHAWVLMSNHLHLVARVEEPARLSDFLRDFKKFTSKALVATIDQINESRRDWLLDAFAFEARRTQRADNFKVWRDDNHAVELYSVPFTQQKIDYIHANPVRQAIVVNPEDYLFSSALDYCGNKGLVPVVVL